MTVTIQIGNTDDKLTQAEWSEFVALVQGYIERYVEDGAARVHFFGASANYERWQNVAWVIEITDEHELRLRTDIKAARHKFRQESVAWTTGQTFFV